MAKGASPEPYRSLTLKFKETDNSFPFRPSLCTTISYSVPFVSLSGKACANNKRLLPWKLCLQRERALAWERGCAVGAAGRRTETEGGKTSAEEKANRAGRRSYRGGESL